MERLEKLFTKTNMSWKRVLLLSVVCGVVPGLLMIPKFLAGTSFRQPGISYEFWVLMAVFIALNCEKAVEAGMKTFVFFLISQPLIYLVQVPFASMGWGLFSYYKLWFILTFFTFPGAMVAWRMKKEDWVSVIILSIGNALLCWELALFAHSMMKAFPHLLITVLFIVAEIIGFILLLFRKKKLRIAAFIIALFLLFAGIFIEWSVTTARAGSFSTELEGNAPFEVISHYNGMEISVDGSDLTVNVEYYMSCPINIRDADGNEFTVYFSYGEDGVFWDRE